MADMKVPGAGCLAGVQLDLRDRDEFFDFVSLGTGSYETQVGARAHAAV